MQKEYAKKPARPDQPSPSPGEARPGSQGKEAKEKKHNELNYARMIKIAELLK